MQLILCGRLVAVQLHCNIHGGIMAGTGQDVHGDKPGETAGAAVGQKDFTVIVNGRQKTVETQQLSFEEVVKLAFEKPPQGPNVIITVTYTGAAGPKPDGTLDQGDHVKIKDGTVFNVTATDRS
jgi:Multiubiquitin